MRVINNDMNVNKCACKKCSQVDNVYRDGYVSIEQQFDQFRRAGINRVEWLKKAYPSETTAQHESKLFEPETVEAFKKASNYERGDDLNIFDGMLESHAQMLKYHSAVNRALGDEAKKAYENSIIQAYENSKTQEGKVDE